MLGRGAHGGLLGDSVGTELQPGSSGIAHGLQKRAPAAEAQRWALWWVPLSSMNRKVPHGTILVQDGKL